MIDRTANAVATATTSSPDRRGMTPNAPDHRITDAKNRFESALERREERQPKTLDGEAAANPYADPCPHGFQHHGRDGGERRERRFAAPEIGEVVGGDRIAAEGVTVAASDKPAAAPATVTRLSTEFSAFVARLDLPEAQGATSIQLTMSDTRWLASQAVVHRTPGGELTLDVATRDGGDDESRQALRARLEARGHRISEIRFEDGPPALRS